MPQSKRQRVKALTQAKKKTSDLKKNVIASIRDAVDKYEFVFAFRFENMRTSHFKNVRIEFRDSRFFLGKNKVMRVAIGRNKEEEYAENLHKLAQDISGSVGLLCTDRPKEQVMSYFNELCIKDYARSGFVATETIIEEAGTKEQFIHSMTEPLRALGLPVDLKNGKVVQFSEYTICKKGKPLTPEQAKLLVHFEHKMAEFKLELVSVWSKEQQTYERIATDVNDTADATSGEDVEM